jgi:hypothetical protein
MAKIKQNLEQLFENNFDCYAEYDKNGAEMPECFADKAAMAMTKEKFVELASNLLAERKGNHANSKPANCAIFDVSVAYELLKEVLEYVEGKQISLPIERIEKFVSEYER